MKAIVLIVMMLVGGMVSADIRILEAQVVVGKTTDSKSSGLFSRYDLSVVATILCVNGYQYLSIAKYKGVGVTQMYENETNKRPQPIRCEVKK